MANELPLEASEDSKNKLIDKIKGLINDKRKDSKSLYYLSSLGEDLGDYSDLIEPYFGLKLRGLVEKKTDEKLIALGKNENVFAIALREDYDTQTNNNPKYKRPFWAAFHSSADQTKPRFINIETLYYSDKRDVVRGGDQIVKEIRPKFFTDHSTNDPVADTHQKISSWLEETGLSSDEFIITNNSHKSSRNLLDSIIKSLDDNQLKNTNLSLDVVKRLMES